MKFGARRGIHQQAIQIRERVCGPLKISEHGHRQLYHVQCAGRERLGKLQRRQRVLQPPLLLVRLCLLHAVGGGHLYAQHRRYCNQQRQHQRQRAQPLHKNPSCSTLSSSSGKPSMRSIALPKMSSTGASGASQASRASPSSITGMRS